MSVWEEVMESEPQRKVGGRRSTKWWLVQAETGRVQSGARVV